MPEGVDTDDDEEPQPAKGGRGDEFTATVALALGVGGAILSVLTIAFVLREYGLGPSAIAAMPRS